MNVLLLLHLLGAVIMVGNIITAAFWKVRADVKGEVGAIHGTVKNVMLADLAFTLPGLLLIIITGTLMAHKAGYSMSGFNWLTLSLMLFALTGVIWVTLLLPLQRSMIRHSALALETGVLPDGYRRASMYWAVFGIAATLLPIVIMYLMVAKPV